MQPVLQMFLRCDIHLFFHFYDIQFRKIFIRKCVDVFLLTEMVKKPGKMVKQKKQQGRPRMSPMERAKSRAARDYRKYLHTFTEEFQTEVERKHVQFYGSSARMGRPPLSLKDHQRKAKRYWDASWSKYVEQCKADGMSPEKPEQLAKFRAKDKSGRRGHDRVIYLLKYIRQQQRKADDAEKKPDENYRQALEQTRGRPPMTKAEKVHHYRNKAEKARQEVLEILTDLPKSEQLYYRIYDLKVDRRQARLCINKPDNPQAAALGLSTERAKRRIKELNAQIEMLESERAETLKKDKPKTKEGRPRKMTAIEASNRAAGILQNAIENGSAQAIKAGADELEYLQRRSQKLDELLKEAKRQQLRKKIEDQERELRELGIDPNEVVANG